MDIRICGVRGPLLDNPPALDVYCIVKVGRARRTTRTIDSSSISVEWNETFQLDIGSGSGVLVELWASDAPSHSLLGCVVLPFPRLVKGIVWDQWHPLQNAQSHKDLRVRMLSVDIGREPLAHEVQSARRNGLLVFAPNLATSSHTYPAPYATQQGCMGQGLAPLFPAGPPPYTPNLFPHHGHYQLPPPPLYGVSQPCLPSPLARGPPPHFEGLPASPNFF